MVKSRFVELMNQQNKSGERVLYNSDYVMICDWCRELNYHRSKVPPDFVSSTGDIKAKPFVYGCTSYRIGNLHSHCADTNAIHEIARKRHENILKEAKNEPSEAMIVKQMLNRNERKCLPGLFTNAYAVMKTGKPFSEYEFLASLDRAKGINIGTTYLNRKQGLEFGISIAKMLQEKQCDEFHKALFFSIILDEFTDVYRMEQVISYIRYSRRGKIVTNFMSIDNVIRATAEQLFEMLLSMLKPQFKWVSPEVPLTGMHGKIKLILKKLKMRPPEPETEATTESSECSSNDECSSNEEEILDINQSDDECQNDQPMVNNNLPLMVGVTSDGAALLKGKKQEFIKE